MAAKRPVVTAPAAPDTNHDTKSQNGGLSASDRAAIVAEVTKTVTESFQTMLPSIVHQLRADLAPSRAPLAAPTADPMIAFMTQMLEREQDRVDELLERQEQSGMDGELIALVMQQLAGAKK